MMGNILVLNIICLCSNVIAYFLIGGTYDSEKPKTFRSFWLWYIIVYTLVICILHGWVMSNNGIYLMG